MDITRGSVYYPKDIQDNLTWWDSTRIPASKEGYDTFEKMSGETTSIYSLKVHNGGDIEAPFLMKVGANSAENTLTIELYEESPNSSSSQPIKKLKLEDFDFLGSDVAIRINGYNMLIEGLIEKNNVLVPSGNIYDRAITEGEIFRIPVFNSLVSEGVGSRDFWLKVIWEGYGLFPGDELYPADNLYPASNSPDLTTSEIEYSYWYI